MTKTEMARHLVEVLRGEGYKVSHTAVARVFPGHNPTLFHFYFHVRHGHTFEFIKELKSRGVEFKAEPKGAEPEPVPWHARPRIRIKQIRQKTRSAFFPSSPELRAVCIDCGNEGSMDIMGSRCFNCGSSVVAACV